MKKIVLSLLIFMAVILLTGCSSKNVEGSLEDIMTKVYENVPEDERPMMLSNIEITDENIESYLGTKIEYKEVIASESMTGSIAHSVVLVRVKDNANVDKIMKEIKENVDPRKWICVEAENVIVKNKGDLIILIMANESAFKLEEGFDNL